MKKLCILVLSFGLFTSTSSFADEVGIGKPTNTTSSTLSTATTTETTDTTDTTIDGTESCTWFQILTGNCK